MIDVMRVGDAWLRLLKQRAQSRARLQREDHPLCVQELSSRPIASAELDLVGEVFGPGRGQVLRMPHRERNDLPACVLEESDYVREKAPRLRRAGRNNC